MRLVLTGMLVIAALGAQGPPLPPPLPADGPKQAVSGRVLDSVTRRPVRGARIVIQRGRDELAAADSDFEGRFRIDEAPVGEWPIAITKSGYASSFRNVTVPAAQPRTGLDIVLDMVRFDERVRGCDLCLTGEGRLDGQSLSGKAVIGVAQAAAKHHVPTVALVGGLGPGHEKSLDAGLKDYIEIGRGLPVEQSIARAAELLEAATARALSLHT